MGNPRYERPYPYPYPGKPHPFDVGYGLTVVSVGKLVLGKFGLVWSQAIFSGPETGQSGPRQKFRTGTARDRLDWSGPGPDLVQTVPGGTFIPGHVNTVRGTWGADGW